MDYLIIVDSVHKVPCKLDLHLVSAANVMMEQRAAEALNSLLRAAMSDLVEIKALSGYRSEEYQQRLWQRSVAEYMCDGLSKDTAERLCARYLARPGHSEHETGLAVDFCSPDWDDTQDDFYSTEQGRWLCKNAARFGFILRYPRMKEHLTGIAYEPWHYRFVGEEHAKIIREQGLTLEEYVYYYFSFLPIEQ